MNDLTPIHGEKGGKKGSAPKNQDDTLKSRATALIVDAISEGPCVGIVGGEDGIFINRTPLSNIEDCEYEERHGNPDDAPVPGFSSTSAFTSIGVAINEDLGPAIRTVSDTSIDLVRVLMDLQYLYYVSKKGAMQAADGGWYIDVRPAGGGWTRAVTYNLEDEKATAPVQFQHDIRLPSFGPGPWDIRVTARFGDRTDDRVYESINWNGFAAITEGKFTYPHTAHVALTLSAEHVGSSMPERTYHYKGRIVEVPTNYDPPTRTYTGIWDGTFKLAWTNNPAWIARDMVGNDIFGIGADIPADLMSKWKLYTIAQYCDGMVPSGYKDAGGNMIMEPRYTFNGVIKNKQQALQAIRQMTTVWRGMGFYSLSQFHLTVDMPQDPAHIYGPANVIDGRFEYATSSVRARHSVVLVRFNDPNNFFEPAVEAVINDELLKKFGWAEKTLELSGCSSRSLARRYGEWVLDTEQNETETVSFDVGLDSIHALPGDVIAVNDPRRAAARAAGRILTIAGDGARITLDGPIPAGLSGPFSVYLQTASGMQSFPVSSTNFANGWVNFSVAVRSQILAANIQPGAAYLLVASNLAPREYRIVSIDENTDANTYKVAALQFDRTKFARVEQGILFDPLPVTLQPLLVEPPTGLNFERITYVDGGRTRTDFEIGWTPPPGAFGYRYEVEIDTPSRATVPVMSTALNSASYTGWDAGDYRVRVYSVNIAGRRSVPLEGSITVDGLTALAVGEIQGLDNAATPGASSFTGTTARIRWRNMMRISTAAGVPLVENDPATYDYSTVRVYTGATLLRTQKVVGSTFNYSLDMNRDDALAAGFSNPQRALRFEVTLTDREGRSSPASVLTLTNPAPAAIVPTVTSQSTNISVDWTPSDDLDIAGYLVWISTSAAYNPASTAPVRTVNGPTVTWTGLPSTTYHVQIAAYDAFGKTGLNYGNKVQVATGIDRFDTVAPAVPPQPTVTSNTEGFTAVWAANSEPDFSHYEVAVATNGGNEVGFTTPTPTYSWPSKPGTPVTVRVRAVDASGNRSNYSAIRSHTTATDTTPPAVPTGLGVNPGFGTLWAAWNANSELDLARYEIYVSTTTTAPTAATAATHVSTGTTLVLTGLSEAVTRHFWIRAVDTSGNKSAWSARVAGTTTSLWSTQGDPAVPTALAITSTSDGRVEVSWTAGANNISYEVGVKEGSGNEVVLGAGNTSYGFRSLPGTALQVRVRGVNIVGKKSAFTAIVNHTVAKDTVAPATPTGLAITPGFGTLWLNWNRNTETDLSHYELVVKQNTTVPPAGATPTYKTPSDTLAVTGLGEGVTRHAFIRAVDTSGNRSAWSDPAVSGTTTSLWSTQNDPTVPTGLSVSSTPKGKVTVSWTAGANNNSYEVGVTEGAGNEVMLSAGDTGYSFNSLSGTTLQVRVRGVNIVGKKSAFTAVVNHTVATDTIAPATPTGLVATGGFGSFWLNWASNTEADLAAYEIYMASAATPVPGAGTAPSFKVAGTTVTVSGLDSNTQRWFWIRAVDISGNRSAWSSVKTATTVTADTAITTEDLAGLIDKTSFATGLEPIKVVTSLPTVKDTSTVYYNNRLYRWDAATSAYVATTDATLITGQLEAGQIKAGAVGADQIAANAVAAKHLMVSDFTNLIPDSGVTDATGWSTTRVTIDPPNRRFVTSTSGTTYLDSAPFLVDVGARYYLSADIALESATSSGDNTLNLRVKDAAGVWSTATVITNQSVTLNAGTPAARVVNVYEVPAGSVAGQWRYFRSTSHDGSVSIRNPIVRRMNGGELLVDGAIKSNHLVTDTAVITTAAQIKSAIIDDGHIRELTAGVLKTGTALAGSITVGVGGPQLLDLGTMLTNFNANNDRISATPTAPGLAGTPVIHTINADGSADIRFRWTFTNGGGANNIDGFVVLVYSAATGAAYTITGTGWDESPFQIARDQRTLIIQGAPADRHYTFGVRSYRVVDTDIAAAGILFSPVTQITTAYQPATSANFTGKLNGTNASTVVDWASDPADRINNGPVTRIDPGKITVSGSTTLSDWRKGGDETRIDGGQLSANTVTANKLVIGNRSITLTGIQFEHNSPGPNELAWTGGRIRFTNDSGAPASQIIRASSHAESAGVNKLWTSGTLYVYWAKGTAIFNTTTDMNVAMGADNVVIATYEGGIKLDADYGRTIVDGASIKTGTITATQLIETAALITKSAQIDTAVIDDAHIRELTAGVLKTGSAISSTITVGIGGPQLLDLGTMLTNFNGRNDRISATPSTPGLPATPIVHTLNADGSADVKFSWTFTNGTGANNIDGFLVFVYSATGSAAYTITGTGSDESPITVDAKQRSVILPGAPANKYYTIGVRAYRTVDADIAADGVLLSPVVQTAAYRPSANANFTGQLDGTGVSTVVGWASNPAARVNAGTTRIDPGKITIQGATTLSDWKAGSDKTTINGGAIEANTVSANKLTIGSRGITLTGIRFEHNSPAADQVSWTGGRVNYVGDGGEPLNRPINSGNAAWTTGTVLYIYWTKGTWWNLSTTTDLLVAMGADNVILATYEGGVKLDADYGRTIVDGSEIKTGTITATQLIKTAALITKSAQIENETVLSSHIVSLVADRITAGSGLAGSITVDGRSLGSGIGSDLTFDRFGRDWLVAEGTTGYVNDPNGSGGRVLNSSTAGTTVYSPDVIPFDREKLYKVTFRIRRNGTAGDGRFSLGLMGLASDRTTPVDRLGGSTLTGNNFPVVVNYQLQTGVGTSYYLVSGYVKGTAASPGAGVGTVASPAKLHNNVRFIRPYASLNLGATTTNQMRIDFVKIEPVLEEAAELVNAGSVTIDPGRIRISGSTTLQDWRGGGDNTEINGGKIAANTVTANKLEIGSRNITLTGITFEHNSPAVNQVSWTQGTIRYVNDNGNAITANIAAGNATWTSGVRYLYWTKPALANQVNGYNTTIASTTNLATALGADNLILATYEGGIKLDADYGKTIVDGSDIKTGTVTATQLVKTAALITEEAQIDTAVINDGHIVELSAGKITTGEMSSERLTVSSLLSLNAENAGLAIGKETPFDPSDGAYFGTDGTGSFGASFGRTDTTSNKQQSLSLTQQEGLIARNLRFRVSAPGLPQSASQTAPATDQEISLPVGAVISFNAIGGGGAGAAIHGPSPYTVQNGASGANTVVRLYDGASLIRTWTANGGTGGNGTRGSGANGEDGFSSPYGKGGVGGDDNDRAVGNAAGNGAGGGGGAGKRVSGGFGQPQVWMYGGRGGKAGKIVSVSEYSTAGLTSPRLVVTTGAGAPRIDAADLDSEHDGGAGSPGGFWLQYSAILHVPANVLPLQPQETGSIVKTGLNITFPDHGAGFWEIWTKGADEANSLAIGYVEVDDSGAQPLNIYSGSFASFISNKTPVRLSGGYNSNRDIGYRFYKMGDWG